MLKKAIYCALLLAFIATPLQSVFAVSTPYRFTGQELDPTGLYYYGQRYYNPNVGRFTQPDPVQFNLTNPQKLKQQTGQNLEQILSNPQNLNPYSYVQNNPVKYVDPKGEFVIPAALLLAGYVFSGVFLSGIQTAQSPTVNSTPQMIEEKSIGDLLPGIKELPKSFRFGLGLVAGFMIPGKIGGNLANKVEGVAEKSLVKDGEKLITVYHGVANPEKYKEILKNGFNLVNGVWITKNISEALSFAARYIPENDLLITMQMPENIFKGLIKEGLSDQQTSTIYHILNQGAEVINKYIIK